MMTAIMAVDWPLGSMLESPASGLTVLLSPFSAAMPRQAVRMDTEHRQLLEGLGKNSLMLAAANLE
jgi:hypothetical protein